MLIKHTLKYVSLKKPRLVVVENVKGLNNSRNHNFLNKVLNFFKKNDYMTWYQTVGTKCFLPTHVHAGSSSRSVQTPTSIVSVGQRISSWSLVSRRR